MKRLFVFAAVAATALVAAAPATAKKPAESFQAGDADVLGPVHVRGDVAKVKARYSCDVGTHIWVSAKQNESATIDPSVSAEGSGFESGAATEWWQSHRGTFTCDGKRHTAWFTIDTVEPGSRGELKKGWAWVQFCLTTEEGGLDAVKMEWSRVVKNR